MTDESSFDAWGEPRSVSGATPNAHGYKGEFLAYRGDPDAGPETVYSLHRRGYAAQQGRFRSEDPAESRPNPYTYAGNDPVNGSDPSGLETFADRLRNAAASRSALTDDLARPGQHAVTAGSARGQAQGQAFAAVARSSSAGQSRPGRPSSSAGGFGTAFQRSAASLGARFLTPGAVAEYARGVADGVVDGLKDYASQPRSGGLGRRRLGGRPGQPACSFAGAVTTPSGVRSPSVGAVVPSPRRPTPSPLFRPAEGAVGD